MMKAAMIKKDVRLINYKCPKIKVKVKSLFVVGLVPVIDRYYQGSHYILKAGGPFRPVTDKFR